MTQPVTSTHPISTGPTTCERSDDVGSVEKRAEELWGNPDQWLAELRAMFAENLDPCFPNPLEDAVAFYAAMRGRGESAEYDAWCDCLASRAEREAATAETTPLPADSEPANGAAS